MGLNEPLWKQYLSFLGDLAQGDLGKSLISQKPVIEQIAFVLPYTLELTAAAILVGLVLGIPIGMMTAVKRRNWPVDYIGRVFSLLGLSFPAFYLGMLFIISSPSVSAGFRPSAPRRFSEPWAESAVPRAPGAHPRSDRDGLIARMTRSVMLTVLSDDYVRTARAKGLHERVVLLRHALRAALIPIVSLVGIFAISLIGSSVLVEEVFARPGLGKLMVGADQAGTTRCCNRSWWSTP